MSLRGLAGNPAILRQRELVLFVKSWLSVFFTPSLAVAVLKKARGVLPSR